MIELLILAIIIIICASLARSILRFLKFDFSSFSQEFLVSAIFGLGLFGYIVYILGLCAGLYKINILALLAIMGLVSVKEAIYFIKGFHSSLLKTNFKNYPIWFLLILLSAFIFTFLGALAPPTGNDSLSYRLAHIRIFIENHRIIYIPFTRESLWPYLTEMLFTAAILIKSDILAKLFAWSFGLLSAGLIYDFSKSHFSRNTAFLASSIFLLTPAIFTQMTYSYVDIPMVCFSFASLICLMFFLEKKQFAWAFLAGAFSGFALSVKFIGLIGVLTLIFIFVYKIIFEKNRKPLLKGFLIFILFLVLCSFGWYLRSYLIKGNPLYPFFAGFFNGHGWQVSLESNIGAKFSTVNLLLLPWNLTMQPMEYGGESIGVFYLLFLPFALILPLKKDTLLLASYCLIFTVLWFFIDPFIVRFLFPVFAVLSIVLAVETSGFLKQRGLFSNFLKVILSIVLSFNILLLFYHNFDKIKVATGLEKRDSYLLRTERTFEIGQLIGSKTPEKAKIMMLGEYRSYYIPRNYIHFDNLVNEGYISKSELGSEGLIEKVKDYGADYLLINIESEIPYGIKSFVADKKPLFTTGFVDKENIKYEYHFYKI